MEKFIESSEANNASLAINYIVARHGNNMKLAKEIMAKLKKSLKDKTYSYLKKFGDPDESGKYNEVIKKWDDYVKSLTKKKESIRYNQFFKEDSKMERYIRKFKEEEFKGDDFYENKYQDVEAMKELELYLENDGDLYRQQFLAIIKNIKQKIKTGRYNHDLAPKLWMYFVEAGAKKYAKEFANASEWMKIFTKPDRIILAKKLADVYYDQIIEGNFD